LWWQGRGEETKIPKVVEESGSASLIETKPLNKDIISEEDATPEDITPRNVVVSFFNYLNQEEYRQAEELLAPDYLEFIESYGGLEQSWRNTPSSEKPAKIMITDQIIKGNTVEVYMMGYTADGKQLGDEAMVPLRKINGKWKLIMPQE